MIEAAKLIHTSFVPEPGEEPTDGGEPVTGRRRALVLAALALAVPLPALALTGGSGSGLAVSASLQGCGVASGGDLVRHQRGLQRRPEGAEYITASVTAPDGSVTDFGNVGARIGGLGDALGALHGQRHLHRQRLGLRRRRGRAIPR